MPISYASKTLGKHDLNKPVIEKELLAIHWGIQFFRPYLYGRKFIVVTDHRPLVSLFSHKNPSSKLTRIRIDLSDYDFEIVYKKGKINTNADALSRIKLDSEMLRNMIPVEEDRSKPSKILVTTRGMKAKENNENVEINNKNDISLGQHKNHMWECASLQDIKNIHELKFNIIKTGIENMKNGPKDGTIENKENKSFVMNVNEDLAKYILSLEKLMIYMHKQNIKNLALSCEDNIFELISDRYLNKIYNEIYQKLLKSNKYRNFELNII